MVYFAAGEGLDAVVEACQHLEELHLQATSLTDIHIHAADWKTSKLRKLHVSWCRNVTEAGFASMICNLKYLENLQICSCGNGLAITDGLARKLALSQPRFLKDLNFRYKNCSSERQCQIYSIACLVQNATGPLLLVSMYIRGSTPFEQVCAGHKLYSGLKKKFERSIFRLDHKCVNVQDGRHQEVLTELILQ